MEYVKRFGGYIADVPKVYLKRCDTQRTFVLDEITQASVTPNVNTLEINAGWSLFPVAVLAGQSTFEMQITSGKFEADLFSFANNKNGWTNDDEYVIPGTAFEAVANDNTITLPEEAVEGSVEIEGFTLQTADGNPTTGNFKVTTIPVNSSNPKAYSKITFASADMLQGKHIRVNYNYKADADYINIDNKQSAICEAVLEFPVYDDGTDCSLSSEIGHVFVKVFKARISQLPGMDGSYKTASTFQFTLSALDPKRTDEAVYQIFYVKK